MWGAITGDVIGSVREFKGPCPEGFTFHPETWFATDDSILTAAVAEAIMDGGSYADSLRRWGRRHPGGGYGLRFGEWLRSEAPAPYGSFGNGSAMRVSPVAWAFDSLERVLAEAESTAAPTHDHPEGVKGAQAVAAAIFVARTGGSRADVRAVFESRFDYNCSRTLEQIRVRHVMDETCRGTIPQAAICALLSTDVEDAIRKAVSLGGDADTLGCITGSIAEAMYGGVPRALRELVAARLPDDLRAVADRFAAHYSLPVA